MQITYTTYITLSQTVKGLTDVSVPVIRSVSKLVGAFITVCKQGHPSAGSEYCDGEFARFYHPRQT